MSLSTLSSQLSAKRSVATFNALHLGDNLIHLHFLRKLAQRYPEIHFTHGAPEQYLGQLAELVGDLPNLTLIDLSALSSQLSTQPPINAWRGAGGWFYHQPDQHDFVSIHLRWFRHLAKLMDLESPITCAADMLFDYPALRASPEPRAESLEQEVDFLIVNAQPMSGQWSGFSLEAFDNLIGHLVFKGKRVVSVRPQRMSVTAFGRISQQARCIIGCVTGPMWPTLNIWNRHTVQTRIHLLDHERVDLIPDRTVHTNSLSLVPELLKDRGLL